ncbi:hypothetical protein KZ083_018600 [Salmonella enterica subsp. enterica serovar Reading]|nr:hypothetical protein KZ083_018600 [Salmonella enterica subsp. enterica serovar Reading]
MAKETAGILKGEYGHTPVPVNAALQARVLEGGAPVTCRPADLLKPELAELEADVKRQAQEKGITLAENAIDDVLTVACSRNPASNSLRTATTRRRLSHCRRRKPRSLLLPGKSRCLRRLHRGSGRQSLCGEGQRRRRYQPAHCG